jgi:hypothetical protein
MPSETAPTPARPPESPAAASGGETYWLTRLVILRWLGFVYLVAFCVAANQLVPLVGAHGLTPGPLYLQRVQAHFGSATGGLLQLPCLFWLNDSDHTMVVLSWAGAALSLAVLLGFANAIIMAVELSAVGLLK